MLHPRELTERIDSALRRIEELFIRQVRDGAQTFALSSSELAACGQFIGEEAATHTQKGIHGTAAALSVLARVGREPAPTLVCGMVRHLTDRLSANTNDPVERMEQSNVIKVSEVFRALSFVKPAICDCSRLATWCSERLVVVGSKGGRSYFFDDPSDSHVEVLPTAYACLALHAQQLDTTEIRKRVEEAALRSSAIRQDAAAQDLAVQIVCLYVLANVTEQGANAKKFDDAIETVWRRTEGQLSEDIEQNIEYWAADGLAHRYARVPWQLYLIAVLARHRPRQLWTVAVNSRLEAVLRAVEGGGFRYGTCQAF